MMKNITNNTNTGNKEQIEFCERKRRGRELMKKIFGISHNENSISDSISIFDDPEIQEILKDV